MKGPIIAGIALAGATILSSCGLSSEAFTPGDWEIEAWGEVDGRSERIEPRSYQETIPQNMAGMDPRSVVFSRFYHGQSAANVVFSNGVISGSLDQSAVAPFPAHEQSVEGWYRADAFEMRIAMPAFGGYQSYQVVSGKLVVPK